jgi:hypothetical protein
MSYHENMMACTSNDPPTLYHEPSGESPIGSAPNLGDPVVREAFYSYANAFHDGRFETARHPDGSHPFTGSVRVRGSRQVEIANDAGILFVLLPGLSQTCVLYTYKNNVSGLEYNKLYVGNNGLSTSNFRYQAYVSPESITTEPGAEDVFRGFIFDTNQCCATWRSVVSGCKVSCLSKGAQGYWTAVCHTIRDSGDLTLVNAEDGALTPNSVLCAGVSENMLLFNAVGDYRLHPSYKTGPVNCMREQFHTPWTSGKLLWKNNNRVYFEGWWPWSLSGHQPFYTTSFFDNKAILTKSLIRDSTTPDTDLIARSMVDFDSPVWVIRIPPLGAGGEARKFLFEYRGVIEYTPSVDGAGVMNGVPSVRQANRNDYAPLNPSVMNHAMSDLYGDATHNNADLVQASTSDVRNLRTMRCVPPVSTHQLECVRQAVEVSSQSVAYKKPYRMCMARSKRKREREEEEMQKLLDCEEEEEETNLDPGEICRICEAEYEEAEAECEEEGEQEERETEGRKLPPFWRKKT